MDGDDLAARRNHAIDRERRFVLLVGHQFIAADDDLIHIPCCRVAHASLAGKAVEVSDEVAEAAAGGKQADRFDGGGCLRGGPDIGAHQAAENLQGFLVLAEIGVHLTEKQARFGAELRIGCGFLEEIDRLGLLRLRALHRAGAAGAEIATRGVLAIRETLEAFEESGFGFGAFVVEKVGEADVEIQRLKRRILGVDQRLEQGVDLRRDRGVFLCLECRIDIIEHAVDLSRRDQGGGCCWRCRRGRSGRSGRSGRGLRCCRWILSQGRGVKPDENHGAREAHGGFDEQDHEDRGT